MSKIRQQTNALLLNIKSGEEYLVRELIQLTYNRLKYVALHYLYEKRYYEDVLDEAYYRAYSHVNKFNVFKDGFNWLCRIVQRVAYNFNNENSRYVLCEEIELDVFNFDEEIDKMLQKDAFYQAVKKLSKLDRQIVYYRLVLDLSYSQIAKKVCRAKSFVHNRMRIILDSALDCQ